MNSTKQNNVDEQTPQDNEIKQEHQAESMIETVEALDPKDSRIIELETDLSNILQRERDNILRAKAEIENIRKRSEQEIEKAHKFALERFSSELLPVIDNLERALKMFNKKNIECVPMMQGIELTLKSLVDTMIKFGVSIVEDINVPFNPEVHQAMTVLESEEYEPNQVIMVIQKGYTLNGRLIRPAMVAVSKSKN